jgi:AraC-like DNA-binding protein
VFKRDARLPLLQERRAARDPNLQFFDLEMKRFDSFRYLPHLPDDDLWGIAVRGAGRARSGPGEPYPPPGHPADHNFDWKTGRVLNSFQIVFISEGRGRFESRRAGLRPVRAGDAMLIFPSAWHRYAPDAATGWVERWIELDGPAIRRVLGAGLFDEAFPIISLREPKQFEAQLDQLLKFDREASPASRTEAGGLGLLLLARLQMYRDANPPAPPSAVLVAAAERLLTASIDRPPAMPKLARELGVGYSHFRRVFKSRTGLSPRRYLQQMRLERARGLLRSTAESLDGIAERVGFSSGFHLSAAFKKEFGLPPMHWRRQQDLVASH